jgi:endonuclease YncB( thermonuclease family)
MLRWWRRKSDGFEWHEYVRTTIKLRREARRNRADELRRQAAGGARDAGRAARRGMAGGIRWLRRGANILARRLGLALGRCAGGVARMAGGAGSGMIAFARPALDMLSRRDVRRPLMAVGAFALAVGVGRAAILRDVDGEARFFAALGASFLVIAALPALSSGPGETAARFLPRIGPSGWRVVRPVAFAALLITTVGGAASYLGGRLPAIGDLPAALAGTRIVEGRAVVLAADRLKVGETVVRLDGIEAPIREQRCQRPGNRNWKCGEAAVGALDRIVTGRVLTCDIGKPDGNGVSAGSCRDGSGDIGARLVRGGHVFAADGLRLHYRTEEEAARLAKAGLWASQNPQRPAAWREQVWTEASRSAPNGCPIKGRVRSGERVYVKPGTPDYDRVRVNAARGGRWFCSEDEARAAGWRLAGEP